MPIIHDGHIQSEHFMWIWKARWLPL